MDDKIENSKQPCQFYIVVGKHDRVFRNSNKSRFFPVANDISLINRGFRDTYEKLRKEKIPVERHLIFLVPDDSYFGEARKLMDKLDPAGKIQIVRPLKKKEDVVKKVAPVSLVSAKAPVKEEVLPKEDKVEKETVVVNTPVVPVIPKEVSEKMPVIEKEKSFGKVNTLTQKEDGSVKDAMDYMEWDSKLVNKHDNTKKLVKTKKHEKSPAFIDLPVIIFILSFLFLVGSVVLLFVLK